MSMKTINVKGYQISRTDEAIVGKVINNVEFPFFFLTLPEGKSIKDFCLAVSPFEKNLNLTKGIIDLNEAITLGDKIYPLDHNPGKVYFLPNKIIMMLLASDPTLDLHFLNINQEEDCVYYCRVNEKALELNYDGVDFHTTLLMNDSLCDLIELGIADNFTVKLIFNNSKGMLLKTRHTEITFMIYNHIHKLLMDNDFPR